MQPDSFIGGGSTNRRFYDALDEKIAKYNEAATAEARAAILNPRSVEILRDSLGEAFTEQGAVIAVDWSKAHRAHKDGENNYLSSRECSEIVKRGLEEVADKEGMNAAGGNVLGMATQEGPAYRAYKENRILILDELNRAKKGTFGAIHGYMQVMIGERETWTANNTLKEKGDRFSQNLIFHRSKIGPNNIVYMTGNTEDDSDEVLEMPEALSSRIIQLQVPRLSNLGWRHIFTRVVVGLPISTMYAAQKNHLGEVDPAEFRKLAVRMRTSHEKRDIPAGQIDLIRRKWADIIEGSERFANAMMKIAAAVNPGADAYKSAGDIGQLLDEINDVFKKEVSVDARKPLFFLSEAFLDKPVVAPPQIGPRITPLLSPEDVVDRPGEIYQNLGTHMTYAILDWAVSISFDRGKDRLGQKLMDILKEEGIVPADLMEGLPNQRRTFTDLLNDNPYKSDDPADRAEVARDTMASYLRIKHVNISPDNDDIASVPAMQSYLEALEEDDESGEADEKKEKAVEATIFSDNPDEGLLRRVALVDEAARAVAEKPAPAPDPEDLVTKTALLFALAAPAVRDRNMEMMWSKALSKTGVIATTATGQKDHGLAMAEGESDTGLSVTTLMVADKGKGNRMVQTPLHVVWNARNENLLIVGEGDIAFDLKKAFRKAGTVYVDRGEQEADKKIDKALARIMGTDRIKNEPLLKQAFLMRVNAAPDQDNDAAKLSSLMVRRESQIFLPLYVTANRMPR